jgi:replicative DNA helicase
MNDLEKSALVSVICHPEMADQLHDEMFMDTTLRQVFQAIPRVAHRTPEGWVNAAILAQEAGVSFDVMQQICHIMVTTREQAHYWVKELAKARNLVEMRDLINIATMDSDDPLVIATKLRGILTYYENLSASEELSSAKDDALAFIDQQIEVISSGREVSLSTGIRALDSCTKGLRPGELTTLVAEGGLGKTTLAMAIAKSLSRQEKTTLMFSGEMTDIQTGERLTHAQLRKGMTSELTSIPDLQDARDHIRQSDLLDRIKVDHRFLTSPAQIRSAIRSQMVKGEVSLVVYDHLQHMDVSRSESDFKRMSDAVIASKSIAKEFGVPFLLLAHLNRSRFQQDKPSMEMIRGTGLIEDISDNVISLWPVEDYIVELYVLKARQGRKDNFPLKYDNLTQSYIEGVEVAGPPETLPWGEEAE